MIIRGGGELGEWLEGNGVVRLSLEPREVWILGFGKRVADRVDYDLNFAINQELLGVIVGREPKIGKRELHAALSSKHIERAGIAGIRE